MPIVDGLNSTKMIRAFEHQDKQSALSPADEHHGGIPILAVSASLVEKERPSYIEAGFDGWILKPIDFRRLNTLLEGIYSQDARRSSLYVPGQWERGGWFHSRQPSWAEDHDRSTEQAAVQRDGATDAP